VNDEENSTAESYLTADWITKPKKNIETYRCSEEHLLPKYQITIRMAVI